jgi:hypothetical protein
MNGLAKIENGFYVLVTGARRGELLTRSGSASATWQATRLEPSGSGRGVTCEHFSIA